MSNPKQHPPVLFKHSSWSPDVNRDLDWKKLKTNQHRRTKSLGAAAVTDDDVRELTACFELGFGFDTCNDLDPKLKRAFPALELYAAVNRQYNSRLLSRSSSTSSDHSSTSNSSSNILIHPNEDPRKVKMRLKQWAQIVGCSIKEAFLQPKTQVTEEK